jgi:hypothetical protein
MDSGLRGIFLALVTCPVGIDSLPIPGIVYMSGRSFCTISELPLSALYYNTNNLSSFSSLPLGTPLLHTRPTSTLLYWILGPSPCRCKSTIFHLELQIDGQETQ